MGEIGFYQGYAAMGNWRRVKIEGTCDREHVEALREALTLRDDLDNFHCLIHTCGIFGLPNWAALKIAAVGNLAERGYDEDSIAATLQELSTVAPSLKVCVHVGGDNEADDCVATVVLAEGAAEIIGPQIDTLPAVEPRFWGVA